MESVSWIDICGSESSTGGFIEKVHSSAVDGLRFDLPTEAEWEYACRAGAAVPFSNSQKVEYENGISNELDAVAWYCRNSDGKTHPAGLKQPNVWGLHDMLGNVWEWCADHYAAYPKKSVTDQKGPDWGSCRVFRGGGWANDAIRCRVAGRDYKFPNHANDQLGFRLVFRSIF